MQTGTYWMVGIAITVLFGLGFVVIRQEVSNFLRASREDEEKNGKTWGPHPD